MLRQFSNEINLERVPLSKLKGHNNSVEALSFRNTNTLVTGDHDGRMIVWDLSKSQPKYDLKIFEEKGIWALQCFAEAFKQSGKADNLVLLGSSDHSVALMDLRTSKISVGLASI